MNAEGQGPRDDEEVVLRTRAAVLAQPNVTDADANSVNLIPFTVGGQPYAVPVDGVRQVRPLTKVARIPRAPSALLGIARIHSTVIPVFDLPGLLGLTAAVPEEADWVLVLEAPGQPDLGIAAAAVNDIRSLPRDAIVQPVGAAQEAAGTWGVTPEGMTVLDVAQLLAAPPVFGAGRIQSAAGPGATPAEPAAPAMERGQE